MRAAFLRVKTCGVILLVAAALGNAALSRAQALVPGQFVPPATAAQLQAITPVAIGTTVVRPLPGNARSAAQAASAAAVPVSGTTLVARASDNLVGISTNDLVVIYPDTAAIVRAAASRAVSSKDYPDMGLTVIHVASFDRLLPLQQALASQFPAARFDLPIRYFEVRPN